MEVHYLAIDSVDEMDDEYWSCALRHSGKSDLSTN